MVQDWVVKKFGDKVALTGGLRVDTTLDPDLQAAAEDSIKSILDKPDDPDAALVSMDDDGAIVAMIGGKDFQKSQVNLATSNVRPQAGSTFKAFDLAAALEKGIPLSKTYPGPATLPVTFPGLAPYLAKNYGNEAFGDIDLTDATAHSVNTVYEQLAVDTGLDRIIKTARDLGVESPVKAYATTPLGTANVSPLEIIRAYMTFANRGRRPEPYFVKRVTDADGRVLFEANVDRAGVYPPKYADIVNYALSQVIARGTGTAAKLPGHDAAGKTGTTDDNTDAWFVGYTPRIGTAVWMGYAADTKQKMDHVHGIEVTGGTFPTRIWQKFMTAAVKDKDTGKFVKPDDSLMNPTTTSTSTSSTSTSSTTASTSSTTTSTTTSPSTTSTTKKPPPTSTTTSSSTTTAPTVKP
jgi:penicillin-binding protein 1A